MKRKPFATLADIRKKDISWLCEPYLMRGALIVLEGHPGQGKSTFCAGLVAAITSESKLPFGGPLARGRVLLFSAEDDPARVLRGRLEANGANLRKVRIQNEPFALGQKGLQLLRQEVELYTPKLVIIDPLVSYLDRDTDLNSASDMTHFLDSLDDLAREFNIAILAVRHHRKSESDHSLHRGLGSIAISGRVRSVLSLGRHPDDIDVRAVAHAKCSWAPEGETILFEIENRNGTSVVKWRGTNSELTADDLLARPPAKRGRKDDERQVAKDFLHGELKKGPVAKLTLLQRAEQRNISPMTLRRAAQELRVAKLKKGTRWLWQLPPTG